ncbi:MAG: hypothetical protein Q7T89_08785 [Anaerolineales bacterium]|nr:hypothetical protein [Anaerolineales bacterium]
MKTKLERIVIGLILAPLAPLALFMGGWWAAYYIIPETWIFLGAVFGFVLGLLADIFLLKKLLDHANTLSDVFWMAIFLFYSVGLFGFFMGVPIFNLALSIPAGLILAERLIAQKADETHVRVATRRAAGFTTIVMTFICAASAIFALTDPYTEANLQGMLALPFDVTRGMVIGLILIGGAGLLILNWWLTSASARFSYRFLQRSS